MKDLWQKLNSVKMFLFKEVFTDSSNTAFFFALWTFWNYFFPFLYFIKKKKTLNLFLNYVLTGEHEFYFQMSIFIPCFRGACNCNKQFMSLLVLHALKNIWLVQHFIWLLQGISNLKKKSPFFIPVSHLNHGRAKDNLSLTKGN